MILFDSTQMFKRTMSKQAWQDIECATDVRVCVTLAQKLTSAGVLWHAYKSCAHRIVAETKSMQQNTFCSLGASRLEICVLCTSLHKLMRSLAVSLRVPIVVVL